MSPKFRFNLPPPEQVIKRNRTITTYYAQLYQSNPKLYKWAGMAAFASFHIGEKMKMWKWENSGIRPISFTKNKKNRSLEENFQIIRLINIEIFAEIGWVHIAFGQLDYNVFKALLLEKDKSQIIIHAFEKLNIAREQFKIEGYSNFVSNLIWEANTEILWHEQSEVVQPLFNELSNIFSQAMTFFASFDYQINLHETRQKSRSRFFKFMLFKGFSLVKKTKFLPQITNLEQRWYWITNDLLKTWKRVESESNMVNSEIIMLSKLEDRDVSGYRFY